MIDLQDNYFHQEENNMFQVAVCSAIGNRKEQQDRVGYTLAGNGGIVVVCDGMGGHSGGKRASNFAVEQLLQCWKGRKTSSGAQTFLMETVTALDKLVASFKNPDGTSMQSGTTLSAVLFEERQMHWISVGDSRVYVYRSPELVRTTVDHTYQTLQQAGQLPPNLPQVSNPESVLISFLGVGGLTRIERNRTALALRPLDMVLLISDGLYKLITDGQIADVLQTSVHAADAAQRLMHRAQERARTEKLQSDNISIAVIKIK